MTNLKVPPELVFYRRMDSLVACITPNYMYCTMPGKEQKHCKLDSDNNKKLADVMMCCKEISKEEFEKELRTDTSDECWTKIQYLLEMGR